MSRTDPNPAPEVIQFVGVSELSPEEQATVKSISTDQFEKIKRQLQNITNMTVHVKCYEKEGGKRKYSMHVKVVAPTKIFDSSKADDWDLAKAMHMACESILHQIQHKFHTDVSRPDRV